MALNTLNLTNSRAVAAPVSSKKSGKLKAWSDAIGATEDIVKTVSGLKQAADQKQMLVDEQSDFAKIELAKAENQDLNSIQLITARGISARDDAYTSIKTNELSREAQIDGAKEGKKQSEIFSDFQHKQLDLAFNSGNEEQKNLLVKKFNNMGEQYSQNIFSQELSETNENKRMYDENTVALANSRNELTNPQQIEMWDIQDANTDAIVAANKNQNDAVLNGWTTEQQLLEFEKTIDAMALENRDNISYVNSLSRSYINSKNQIEANGAKKRASEVIEIRNNSEIRSAKVLWENPNSPQLAGEGLGNSINSLIATGKSSEQNTKNSLMAQLNEWNSPSTANGNVGSIPNNVVNFLKQDRPDGTAGWYYTDGSIKRMVDDNSRMVFNQGKAPKEAGPTEDQIYEAGKYLKDLKGKEILNIEEIKYARENGLISKAEYFKYRDDFSTQEDSRVTANELSEILSMERGDDRTARYTALSIDKSPDSLKYAANKIVKDSFTGSDGKINIPKLQETLVGNPDSPIVRKMISTAELTGYMPDSLTNMMNSNLTVAGFDEYASNISILSTSKDQDVVNFLKSSMTKKNLDRAETFINIMKDNPDLERSQIVSLVNKTERQGVGFIAENQSDLNYGESNYKKDLMKAVDDISKDRSTGILGFFQSDGSNRKFVTDILGRTYNQISVLNPEASAEEKMEMAKSKVRENYIEIGGIVVPNNTTTPKDIIARDYSPKMNDFKNLLAQDYFGDYTRGNDIYITTDERTAETGLYSIHEKGTNVKLGSTYMMEHSDGINPSFLDSANGIISLNQIKSQVEKNKRREFGRLIRNGEFSLGYDKFLEENIYQVQYDNITSNSRDEYDNEVLKDKLLSSPKFLPVINSLDEYDDENESTASRIERRSKIVEKEILNVKETYFNPKNETYLKDSESITEKDKNLIVNQYLTRQRKENKKDELTMKEIYAVYEKHVAAIKKVKDRQLNSKTKDASYYRNSINFSKGDYSAIPKIRLRN